MVVILAITVEGLAFSATYINCVGGLNNGLVDDAGKIFTMT